MMMGNGGRIGKSKVQSLRSEVGTRNWEAAKCFARYGRYGQGYGSNYRTFPAQFMNRFEFLGSHDSVAP